MIFSYRGIVHTSSRPEPKSETEAPAADHREPVLNSLQQKTFTLSNTDTAVKQADSTVINTTPMRSNISIYDVITEEECLSDPPILNTSQTSNADFSVIELVDRKSEFQLGDTITVRVVMFDGYRKRKQTGGDFLRVCMREEVRKAGVCARIHDLNNGTYIAHFKVVAKIHSVVKLQNISKSQSNT